MSLVSAARLHAIFYPAYYLIERGTGQKYFLDSELLQFGNVFSRNDAATDDRYIICPVLCPG